MLEPSRESLKALRESGGKLMLYVGVFVDEHLGFKLDLAVLSTLSSLGLEIGVEVYPP